jgi:hypothetical protein
MEGESFSSRLLQRVVDKKNSLYLFLSNVFQNHFIVFPRRQDVSLQYIYTPVSNLGSHRLTSRSQMNYEYISVIVISSRLIIG